MQWESTDNFGNLSVATSNAQTPESLKEDLQNLVTTLFHRWESTPDLDIKISIDVRSGEICGPDSNQVSHIMEVPWLSKRVRDGETPDEVYLHIHELTSSCIDESSPRKITVQGPWED